jgi:hypothetical protein
MEKFKAVVGNRKASRYVPSFRAAEIIRISPRALSRITSSFMVMVGHDKQKINLGLSLKFEAKSLKVVDYTRKDGRHWEYSEKAVELIKEYKVRFPFQFGYWDRSAYWRGFVRLRSLRSLDVWMMMAMGWHSRLMFSVLIVNPTRRFGR